MIFICTSMYFEAEPIINTLSLKKDLTSLKFQIFKNTDVTLIITGCGKIKSAIALTYLLTKCIPDSSDLFINIGIAGCSNKSLPLGSTFICNKIIDYDTNRTFFPDILFKHPFNEISIETHSTPNYQNDGSLKLYDMESSALYCSALTFFQPHQTFFIKIVSDYLNVNKQPNKEEISNLINTNLDLILKWIFSLNNRIPTKESILPPQLLNKIVTISNNLKFSASMTNEFKQIIMYSYLKNMHSLDILSEFINLKCKSKKEGKIYLEQFRKELV